VAKKAFAALPETVTTYYYRGDSACHESDLINWLAGVYKIESRNGSKFGRSKGLGVAGVYVLTGAVQREAGA
jgi:hypothetical protein